MALMGLTGMTLVMAKRSVHESPAWADVKVGTKASWTSLPFSGRRVL
jgi:hypothetical protein